MRGKDSKWLVLVVDGQGIPLGGAITSAPPSEVTLAEMTLETIKVPRQGRGRQKSRPKRQMRIRLTTRINCEPAWVEGGSKGSITVCLAFFHLACPIICPKAVLK
jgi:hypothetical protein